MKRNVWHDLLPLGVMVAPLVLGALIAVFLVTSGVLAGDPPLKCEYGTVYARLLDGSERCVILPPPNAGGM